jgi:hypothetical protein
MRYKEMLVEYYNPDEDAYTTSSTEDKSVAKKTDTRRPRITFNHLTKMRTIRRVKRLEKQKHNELVRDMYGTPAE